MFYEVQADVVVGSLRLHSQGFLCDRLKKYFVHLCCGTCCKAALSIIQRFEMVFPRLKHSIKNFRVH